MIVRTRAGGDMEIRSSWPDRTVPPRPSVAPAASGEAVTTSKSFGLPAFGAAVRMVAGVIAASDLDVYQGEAGQKRERPDSWQAKLFDQPCLNYSQFDWLWDIASSLETYENAILQKIKGQGRVLELRPVPMEYVVIYRDRDGSKVIEINDVNGWKRYGPEDVLHIRGQTLGAGVVGVSKVVQHSDPIGAMLAAQRFEGAYFRNHARPDVALLFPEGVSQEQAGQWKDYWNNEYGGAQNFGKAVPLGGGATVLPIPISMKDAQFLEARQMSVEDVARIMGVPGLLLEGSAQRIQGDALRAATDMFMHLHMPPRIARIEEALKADQDLFGSTKLYPRIEIDELAFLDPLTRAQTEHERIQDGTQLVDEVRASHGWAPLPAIPKNPELTPGMVPQLTPVGGAPNPQADPAPAATQENSLTVPSVELRVEQNMEPAARTLADAITASLREVLTGHRAEVAAQEKRNAETVARGEARDKAHMAALERAAAPNVVVNVEPTPVQITNDITVQPAEVQLSLVDADDSGPVSIDFQRNPNGTIKSARITEGI